MRKYINDKAPFAHSVDEISGQLIYFDGHDTPRYVFPENTEAGQLGILGWYDYWNKPVYSSEGTGTLDSAKFYAIKVVPIKRDMSIGGLPVYGDATQPSMPQQPSAASKSLVFTIPTHEQSAIKEVGFSASDLSDGLYDDTQTWTVNEFAGKILKNVETGLYSTIYRNTETTLFAYGVDFSDGDRYQILQPTITSRLIYAAEMTDATNPESYDYYLIEQIDDNSTGTYELVSFAESSDIWTPAMIGTYLPAPNANCCKVAGGLAFCGGGISDETGKASYEGTLETAQATATADEQIAVTVVDDEYSGANLAKITRLTLGSALTGFEKAVVGSYVTITGSEDSGNDIEDARVLRVNDFNLEATAPDGSSDIAVGTFSGSDCVDLPYSGWADTAMGTFTLSIEGTFSKSSITQVLFSRVTYSLGSYNYRIRLCIESDNSITLKFDNSTRITVAAGSWTDGYQTLSLEKAGTAVTLKSDGSTIGSGTATATLGLTPDVVIGAEYEYPSSRRNYFVGNMRYIEWEDTSSPAASFKYVFDAGSGTLIEDLTNSSDGTLDSGDPSAFWANTISENLNTGNGTATTPSPTALATEDLWTLTCKYTGGDVRTATGTGADSIAVSNPTGTTARYTLGANLADFASVEVGSRFTSTGFTNAGNDVTNAVITAVDASLRYVEITNASVVAETDDTDAEITISAVFGVVGTLTGTDDDLIVGTAYSNDYFSLTISDGTSDWAADDFLVFNVIKSVVTDIRWIEILNNDGTANADDETMLITLTPNYIQGNVTGADATAFSKGMESAQFQFPADKDAPYSISWVDPITQRLGLASKYSGINAADDALSILSDYGLYVSDSKNPHRWRIENIIDIGDSITGISSAGDNLIVGCKNSLWRIPLENLSTTPILLSNNVRCPAQFSFCVGEKLVLFYDGTGFSVTDGVTVTSVTSYKARDYLAQINKAYESQIVGTYDRENKRFEFAFPLGTDTKNNYGLYITEGSWNCYPFSRQDCAALWTNYSEGNLSVFHGTGADLVASGVGTVWEHTGYTDGTPTTGSYLFEITAITGQVISVSSDDGDTGLAEGDIICIYPATSGGKYMQLVVSEVSKTSTDPSPVTYDIAVASQYDISAYEAGDIVAYGLIPFDYGIKWTDFSSPQYKHQVRALHLDLDGAYGLIYVDHYKDMEDYPVSTSGYSVYPNNTKLVIPFRQGKCYKYGFRLRGLSLTQVKISAFEIMFDTTV